MQVNNDFSQFDDESKDKKILGINVTYLPAVLLILIVGCIFYGCNHEIEKKRQDAALARVEMQNNPDYYVIILKDNFGNTTDTWKYKNIYYRQEGSDLHWYEATGPDEIGRELGRTNAKYTIIALGKDKKKFDECIEFHK